MISNNFSVNNSYSPNFKGVNLVQTSKKVFQNAENLNHKESLFGFYLEKAIKPGNGFSELLSILGLGKNKNKIFTFLESPCYAANETALKQYGNNYSFEWLKQNAGARGPLKDDLDSFWILTGKHKIAAEELTSVKNRLKLLKNKDFNGSLETLRSTIRMNNEVDDMVFKMMQDADIKKFSADTADEIVEIAKRIDLNA